MSARLAPLFLVLVACWRNAPAPQAPEAEAEDQGPPPPSRVLQADPPRPTDHFGVLIQQFEGYADAMCQCADSSCAYSVLGDLQKWADELMKEQFRPDNDQSRQFQDVSRRLTDCMSKAMSSAAGSPTPTP